MDDGDVGAALELINKRLDWVEEHVGRLYGVTFGVNSYVPMGRADHRPDVNPVPPEVVALARAGKKLDAIKRYRELTGIDFDHARAVVSKL
jgi:ribosomal protein L7/L12